jgi:hypothetical protein
MAEVAYERQLKIQNILRENTYANIYYSLYGRYKNALTDIYFIHEPNYLSYKILNMAQENSYLETYHNLFKAYKDNITLHKGPFTLAWLAKYDDITKNSTILNKKDDVNLYFSIDTKQEYELYRIEQERADQLPIYHNELYNEMILTFYGLSGAYTIKYIFDSSQKGNYMGQYVPYILTFNGDFENPEFHFYIDGKEPKEPDLPKNLEALDVQRNRTVADLYDTIQYGEPSMLLDMPDYSLACPLKNYITDLNTGEKINYDNGLGTSMIIALKKQANKHDVAFLSSVMRSLGELDD